MDEQGVTEEEKAGFLQRFDKRTQEQQETPSVTKAPEAKQAKESLKSIVEDKKQRDKSFKDAASAALKNIGN